MRKLISIIFIVSLFIGNICFAQKSALVKPTGQYGVGFQTLHWLNYDFGLDFNFNGKNFEDFSKTNIKHIHEVLAVVYYPTTLVQNNKSIYNNLFIREQQNAILRQMPNINKTMLAELNNINNYAIQNSSLIDNHNKFPVIIFAPGFGYPVEAYENIIAELVSHGYIVIGVNTASINPFELDSGHIVQSASNFSEEELEHKLIPLQMNDLIFTIKKLQKPQKDILFSKMDLDQISLLGHSLGGISVANIAHNSENNFVSAVALDIGHDPSEQSLLPFKIPFMHIVAADRKLPPPNSNMLSVVFNLNKDNYLVTISPDEKNHEYSSHDNFTDLSSLQNLTAFKELKNLRYKKFKDGFVFKVSTTEPPSYQRKEFEKVTYILFKKDDMWRLTVYDKKTKIHDLDVTMVAGLDEKLSDLDKLPNQFTASEIKTLELIIKSLHYILFGKSFIGNGHGRDIVSAINLHLVDFFNAYIKGKNNNLLAKCNVRSKNNSFIKCGSGKY